MSKKTPLGQEIDQEMHDGNRGLSRRSLLRLGLTGGALILTPAVLAACSTPASPKPGESSGAGTPKRGGTLTIGADADPVGLDPRNTWAFSSYDFTALIYTGLLRWNAKMEIEPDLATSYETPDDTTYIFKLRKGVKFHNGQELTAADVQASFDSALAPLASDRMEYTFPTIKAVSVIDPLTVKFELKNPDAAFLSYMASNPDGAIVPKGVEDLDTKPIGTGPFMFDSYEPNQQLTLVANPDYYEESLPYLSTVVFRFFKDQSSLSSALRSKAIDMTWFKDPKVAAQMTKASTDIVSAPGQTARTFPIWLNLKDKPLNDVNVRRALSLATDRQACLQTVLGGSGKVGAMIPESQVGGYDGSGDLPYYKHDVAKAKKLLADSGYTDGIDLGDYIVVAANPLDVACAQILQQQWAEAGIKVNLKPMETAPLLDLWNEGTWPTLLSVALSWTPDPDAILQRVTSSGGLGKAMGMSDEKLDSMINDARAELDLSKRAAANSEIQKRIAEYAYVLQVYQYPLRWEAWRDTVHGYVPLAANTRSFVRTSWIGK